MSKIGQFFYIDSGDEYWEIGRVTGPKEDGYYPFEFLVAGFNPDDEFLHEAKFEGGFKIDDDNFEDGRDDKHSMIDMIFTEGAYWILDRWRRLKQWQ